MQKSSLDTPPRPFTITLYHSCSLEIESDDLRICLVLFYSSLASKQIHKLQTKRDLSVLSNRHITLPPNTVKLACFCPLVIWYFVSRLLIHKFYSVDLIQKNSWSCPQRSWHVDGSLWTPNRLLERHRSDISLQTALLGVQNEQQRTHHRSAVP